MYIVDMTGGRQVGRQDMYQYNSPNQMKYNTQAAASMPMSQAQNTGVRRSPNPSGNWPSQGNFGQAQVILIE